MTDQQQLVSVMPFAVVGGSAIMVQTELFDDGERRVGHTTHSSRHRGSGGKPTVSAA
ncbi:hypothetical protein [Saccharopolyspora thermophila]|uniref:hypothetical protein n=1 Tax=Saccharopolyspora thermophila TaxID=89367 RepID=UPI001668EC62|nr:hypothetical protein [Saccharopolyspora subtropica]